MASGTLVPFMSEVALPGDSFDIDLACDVKTLPTVGPLFGSYKVQLDVFQCPVRLYNGKLHMNMLNIGMDMSQILLPQIEMFANEGQDGGDNTQINSSSIYSYLNMRGLGLGTTGTYTKREFNAVPYLGYWDIYKNYYANKQEERGYVIHAADLNNKFSPVGTDVTVQVAGAVSDVTTNIYSSAIVDTSAQSGMLPTVTGRFGFNWGNAGAPYGEPDVTKIKAEIAGTDVYLDTIFTDSTIVENSGIWTVTFTNYIGVNASQSWDLDGAEVANTLNPGEGEPQLTEFPLDNIDDMRMDILESVRDVTAFKITESTDAPYGLGLKYDYDGTTAKVSGEAKLGIGS